jgi:hypothetical protein
LLFLLLNLDNVLVFFEFGLHVDNLFFLGKQLLVHAIHGSLTLLCSRLKVSDLSVEVLELDSLLVELALVLSDSDLIVFFFFTYDRVYVGLILLQLLNAGIVLLKLGFLTLERFEQFFSLSC